jgi:hypothetical protein
MITKNDIAVTDTSPSEVTRRDLLVGLIVLVAACGGTETDDADAADALDPRVPYPPWNSSIRSSYLRTMPDGTLASYVTDNAGVQVVAGGSYQRLRMRRATSGDPPPTSAEIWVDPREPTKLVLAGGAYTSDSAKTLGLPAAGSFTLTAPVTVDLDAPPGKPQSFDIQGSLQLAGTPETALVRVQGTSTVAETNVTVSTSAGAISGCTHLVVEGGIPLVFGAMLVSARGEIWISPGLGVVQARFDEPLAGFGVGAQGTRTSRDLGDGYASVEGVGIVGAGASNFELSTTEASGGEFDADKNTHAKLLLEIRWVDEALAHSGTRPHVTEELGTVFGYFPETLVQSPVSFLHPEEAGQGYVYWIAFASQAAKNEAGPNGIAYHTSVRYDPTLGPVRVSSRIIYKRITTG